MATTSTLSNIQLELLRVYSRHVSDEDMVAIQKMLATYFSEKAIHLADEVWDKNGWKAEDTGAFLKEHNRKSKAS
ncbi:hypothetical protein FHS57_000181 [Runella defluvii]|uniref:Uncharacterized protein n=1 Tax=Runella defluvii TaxID=370973 RepID=A0A7W5ZG43_9BACT|nr:hypothetical protein [Runella defluvii]MBB3836199.1 hypothetical protein [Runella defluvii]